MVKVKTTNSTTRRCSKCQETNVNRIRLEMFGKVYEFGKYCESCLKIIEDAERQDKQLELFRKAQVPHRYYKEIDSIERHSGNKYAYDLLQKYKYRNGMSPIVLYGDNSAGKTLLLARLVKTLSYDFIPTIILNEGTMGANYRSNFCFETDLSDILIRVKVVLLDDIGKVDYYSEYYSNFLYNLWNDLSNMRKVIVATTNFSPNELNSVIDLAPKS